MQKKINSSEKKEENTQKFNSIVICCLSRSGPHKQAKGQIQRGPKRAGGQKLSKRGPQGKKPKKTDVADGALPWVKLGWPGEDSTARAGGEMALGVE